MFTLKKINQSLTIAGFLTFASTPVFAAPAVTIPNTFTAGGTIVADEMNANFTAIVDGINNLPTSAALPVGSAVGDILYWDGSVWQLSPAPPAGATPTTLTLTSGVPTWTVAAAAAKVTYAIGDTGPAGGIVFYTTNGGEHGLEAAPVDLPDATWGCMNIKIMGFQASYIGGGLVNAHRVANTPGCTSTQTAAALAYSLNGHSDWYLPSTQEMYTMYSTSVGNVNLPSAGIYWTSSDQGTVQIVTLDMGSGNVYAYSRDVAAYKARAIRTF